jgi:hypothetical protein
VIIVDRYIGVKLIRAEPCTAERAAKVLNRSINTEHADEEGNGYLVEYDGGYRSWSPAGAFEGAYRKNDCMTFGLALEALKAGKKVARAGWNGKGMYIALQDGSLIDPEDAIGGAARALVESGDADEKGVVILPHIDMKSANGDIVVGWLASQTDMLSEDWEMLE